MAPSARFADRADAGRALADRCRHDLVDTAPGIGTVVLGLPRGGVPVAAAVADALAAPLDVLVVRKIGCPWQPELGVGAIGEHGIRILQPELLRRLDLDESDLDETIRLEQVELARRVRRYRGERPMVPVRGRRVVVVDDGIATGGTARAAIEVLRDAGAAAVVLAVPVAPPAAVDELGALADQVVTLATPGDLGSVGAAYDDFAPTSDDEVAAILARYRPGRSDGRNGAG